MRERVDSGSDPLRNDIYPEPERERDFARLQRPKRSMDHVNSPSSSNTNLNQTLSMSMTESSMSKEKKPANWRVPGSIDEVEEEEKAGIEGVADMKVEEEVDAVGPLRNIRSEQKESTEIEGQRTRKKRKSSKKSIYETYADGRRAPCKLSRERVKHRSVLIYEEGQGWDSQVWFQSVSICSEHIPGTRTVIFGVWDLESFLKIGTVLGMFSKQKKQCSWNVPGTCSRDMFWGHVLGTD